MIGGILENIGLCLGCVTIGSLVQLYVVLFRTHLVLLGIRLPQRHIWDPTFAESAQLAGEGSGTL